MDLFLIRHAQSSNNAGPQEERVDDPGLTELGHRQARKLGEWIPKLELTRLITSPFLRCLQTTECVYESTGLLPEVWVDLHEQGGCLSGYDHATTKGETGMTNGDFSRVYPDYIIPDEIDQDGWWKRKSLETLDQAQERAKRVRERTLQEFASTEERIAFISHGDFKRILVGTLVGSLDNGHKWVANCANTALTEFRINEESIQLCRFNCVPHLSDEMVS